MLNTGDLRSFIIEWNNTFPLDREYRKKHQIGFNSTKHREVNQIDIYLEWIEDKVWDEFHETSLERAKKEELYKKGEWISKNEKQEQMSDEDFDKIEF